MRTNISGLDHAVILVRDLDAAQATYARLGLTLTPRGFHSIGTHNHCIMFGSDYPSLPYDPAKASLDDILATIKETGYEAEPS